MEKYDGVMWGLQGVWGLKEDERGLREEIIL